MTCAIELQEGEMLWSFLKNHLTLAERIVLDPVIKLYKDADSRKSLVFGTLEMPVRYI